MGRWTKKSYSGEKLTSVFFPGTEAAGASVSAADAARVLSGERGPDDGTLVAVLEKEHNDFLSNISKYTIQYIPVFPRRMR